MTKFIKAYYGTAAPYIDRYINIMADELEKSGEGLGIFGQPDKERFLSKEIIPLYKQLFSEAKAAVKDDEKLLLRVEEDELGLIYAILKAKLYDNEDEKQDCISFFRRVSKAIGLEKVEEWTMTVDMFLDSVSS